jgi:hypothetical protein
MSFSVDYQVPADCQDRTFGEIDVLFENRIPARKFKYTKADRKSLIHIQ